MHPARSVIAFTTLSGAGYGLLFWLGVLLATEVFTGRDRVVLIALAIGTALVTAGLVSSTLHLHHPERAWRAFSQWRSSWLSREGVAAVLTYIPIVLCALCTLFAADRDLRLLGALLALGCAVTVTCTAMIYASLKSIARWHHPLVLPLYLLFALLSGAVLLLALAPMSRISNQLVAGVIALLLITWIVKWWYWRSSDAAPIAGTINSATGLEGRVSIFDPPHTEQNYLLKEMGFSVARKHARKLRILASLIGVVLPLLLLLATPLVPWPSVTLVSAAVAVLVATAVERWLFFAEAQHSVTHYYGADSIA